ncbi:hypothetical protein GCM10017776_13610 [Streptomyces griseoluteus]|nr:hypothetical protein GCM10017776_13610 [Streptomyces griseoluteus]
MALLAAPATAKAAASSITDFSRLRKGHEKPTKALPRAPLDRAGRTRPREALAEAPARIHSFGYFLC